MVTLVTNRPFKKRKKNTIKKQIRKVKLIYPSIKFSIKWLWIFVLFVIFFYGIFFIVKNTIFKAENYVDKIFYSKVSVDNYDNPYLYKKIGQLIKDENYFVVSVFRKGKILATLRSEFPIVKNIKIVQSQKFSASIWIDFYDPDIIIRLGDRKFGVLGDYDFEIFSGNKIGDGVFFIDLPQYVSGINSLHGLFFEISPEKLINDMDILSQGFEGYTRLVYLPGSSMSIVFLNDNKRVYLNNKNSLTGQIDNYNLLMKYYDEASSLKIIDIGSLEGDKIIVRK